MKNTVFLCLSLFLTSFVFGQVRNPIKGKLLYKNTNVVAANVVNNTDQTNTITDQDGEFEIDVAVGDEVICQVAEIGSDIFRQGDIFGRIGGEEFAAILPDANIEQARAIAEHIREKIQGSAFTNQDNNIEISVSIGIATIREVSESFDGLLHAADMAMYKAKKNGRNRVSSNSVESEEKQN